MSTAHLRFSTGILSRLGEELNPNIDHGLLELVKNAYDADARHCTIELVNTHEVGGTVRITDDGSGMDRNAVEEGWLVLGRSPKLSSKRTPKFGRLPAGNKGLGRLAALRMGSVARLQTRPENESCDQFEVDLDWSTFELSSVVEEVRLDIRQTKRAPESGPGTDIAIHGLTSRLTPTDVKRLARGLLLLADPFEDNPAGFSPVLKAPEFRDFEELVRRRYYDDAEFHLLAELSEDGRASASVVDWKGKTLYTAEHSDLSKEGYRCPAATFDLWAFILTKASFSQRSAVSLGDVKEWLGKFGGVHLYTRGLRIVPYGDPGNDWLDMNLHRARSPEGRPSTNTAVGRISVSDPDEVLLQKTDRSGLAEDEPLRELKRFATDALNWMAKRRLEERDKRKHTEREKTSKQTKAAREKIDEAIKELPAQAQPTIQQALEKYAQVKESEAETLRKEVQLYRTMSTAGITAAVFAHEAGTPVSVIHKSARLLANRGKDCLGQDYEKKLQKPIERIQRQAETLDAFSHVMLNLVDHERRRAGRVDIHSVIGRILETLTPFLGRRHVKVRREFASGDPYLRASEAAIESIVMNLLSNSLKAFEQLLQGDRKVDIRTEIADGTLTLRVLDNGPGIQGVNLRDIWLPGETTYPNGTGLGLTIVRDTVKDLGGRVDARKTGELGGAEIIVELPILGA